MRINKVSINGNMIYQIQRDPESYPQQFTVIYARLFYSCREMQVPVACALFAESIFPHCSSFAIFHEHFRAHACVSRVCSAGTCGFNVEQKKILARVLSGTRVCVRACATCNFNTLNEYCLCGDKIVYSFEMRRLNVLAFDKMHLHRGFYRTKLF